MAQLSGTPRRDPSLLTPLALLDPASSWVQRELQPLSLVMLQTAEPPASLSFPAVKAGTVKGVMLLPWTPGQDPLSELKHQSSADRGRPGLSCLIAGEVLSQGEDLEQPAAKRWQPDLVVRGSPAAIAPLSIAGPCCNLELPSEQPNHKKRNQSHFRARVAAGQHIHTIHQFGLSGDHHGFLMLKAGCPVSSPGTALHGSPTSQTRRHAAHDGARCAGTEGLQRGCRQHGEGSLPAMAETSAASSRAFKRSGPRC